VSTTIEFYRNFADFEALIVKLESKLPGLPAPTGFSAGCDVRQTHSQLSIQGSCADMKFI
jgi:hypothetical protein